MNFSAFTISSNGLLNTIKTNVEIKMNDKVISVSAIWDTGATQTCISTHIVKELGLTAIGYETVHTANGITDVGQYIVDVVLPNRINVKGARVNEFTGGPSIDMLIGMDIISKGDLSITNANGKTVVSFRYPPDIYHIDYVKMSQKDKHGKLAKEHLKRKQARD